jgi:hypothetical protein
MRLIAFTSAVVLACCLALPACSERPAPPPEAERIDPAELEAVRAKLSRVKDEVKAASARSAEVYRKARAGAADAGPAPAPAD